MKGINCKRN